MKNSAGFLHRVFPTRVGVFPGRFSRLKLMKSLPHTRGGVSATLAQFETWGKSSPHAWGCFESTSLPKAGASVFPTRVGVFLVSACQLPSLSCLPHTRGGVSVELQDATEERSSSPHAWGCFYEEEEKKGLCYVFPTRVGVFLVCEIYCVLISGLPHTRGGVSDKKPPARRWGQSSPHAWGCFSASCPISSSAIVFPTRVGVFLLLVG